MGGEIVAVIVFGYVFYNVYKHSVHKKIRKKFVKKVEISSEIEQLIDKMKNAVNNNKQLSLLNVVDMFIYLAKYVGFISLFIIPCCAFWFAFFYERAEHMLKWGYIYLFGARFYMFIIGFY